MPDAYRTTCSSALLDVAAAVTRLSPDADKLQPLFITLDPRRDTPTVMGNYIQSFDSRIVGLTGTPQQIAAVAQEYGVYSNLVRAGRAQRTTSWTTAPTST